MLGNDGGKPYLGPGVPHHALRHVWQRPMVQSEKIRDGPILTGRMARGIVAPGFNDHSRQTAQLFARNRDAKLVAII
jgi:hypothetical protein